MAAGDSGRIAGLDAGFLARFEEFRRAAHARHGIRVRIVSGFRTRAEQEYLWKGYQRKLAGIPGNTHFNLAARPGTSRHESGRAIDMDPDVAEQPRLRPILAEFGLTLPVPGEPWHVELDRNAPPLPAPPPPVAPQEDDMYHHYLLHPGALGPGEPQDWLVTPGGQKFGTGSTFLVEKLRVSGNMRPTIDLTGDLDASTVFRNQHP